MKTYSVSEPFIPNPMYVAETGSDETGDGTELNPFRQIRYAISKCKKNIQHIIYVDAGTYQSFSASYYKCIYLMLRGNIIINPQDTDYDIFSYMFSDIRINGTDGITKTLQLNNCSDTCVHAERNSCISLFSDCDILFNNINNVNIFNCGSNSFMDIVCNSISHSGNLICSRVFTSQHGSAIVYRIRGNSTLGNAASDAFIISALSAQIYADIKHNINNTNKVGLYAQGGIINTQLSGQNNAQTQVIQTEGGRVFINTSSTLNSISPTSDSTQGIENGESIENIENDSTNSILEANDPRPVD